MNRYIPEEELSKEELLNLLYQGIDKVMVYKDNLLEICWKFQDVFAELEGGENEGDGGNEEDVAGKKVV